MELAKKLYRNCDEYYFWMDDATKLTCHCDACKKHNFAYHQLTLMNEIATELRKENPNAKVCYLAYYEGVAIPIGDITPAPGVFVEYAPFERYTKPDQFSWDEPYLQLVKDIVAFFGKKDSKVLEYWYDNSMFSKWTKLPKAFVPRNDLIPGDLRWYESLGFAHVASFACYLGEDYVNLYGEPDISAFC